MEPIKTPLESRAELEARILARAAKNKLSTLSSVAGETVEAYKELSATGKQKAKWAEDTVCKFFDTLADKNEVAKRILNNPLTDGLERAGVRLAIGWLVHLKWFEKVFKG